MDPDDPDMTRDYVFTADYREYIQGVLSWGRRRDASSDATVRTDGLCGIANRAPVK